MRKSLTAALAVSLAFGYSAPALAIVSVNEALDSATSVDSGWTLDGRTTPSMVEQAEDTPKYALQITNDQSSQVGIAQYNRTLNISSGLDFSFHFAQWGGEGDADGLVFFVRDASDTDNIYGGVGGNQGYTPGDNGGLSHALLGVSFDAYGGFGDFFDSTPSRCVDGYGSDDDPNYIWVRGDGNGTQGYCVLGNPASTQGLGLRPFAAGYTSRAEAARVARIVIDPLDGTDPHVKVYYDGTLVQDVAAPELLINTPNVKIGFTAASGGSTNFHEVWGIGENPTHTLANTGGSLDQYLWLIALGLAAIYSGQRMKVLARREN